MWNFAWTWEFELLWKKQERQGFLHLAALLDTQIWRPQGDLSIQYNLSILLFIFRKI